MRVYPGARYSASHTSKLAHPQQMCQRPLCFRQRDLCAHPADYFWHVAKTLDSRFAGFVDPLELGCRFGILRRACSVYNS